MYIDNNRVGENPLKDFLNNGASFGKLGRDAEQYRNEKRYLYLRKDPDFIAAIQAMHNADVEIKQAGHMIFRDEKSTSPTKRLYVGVETVRRDLNNLTENEALFFEHLAKARVELVAALERFQTANANDKTADKDKKISYDIIPWTRGSLENLDNAILKMGANVLNHIEDLAAHMHPEPSGKAVSRHANPPVSATGIIDPGHLAAAQLLENKFPGITADDALKTVSEILDLARGVGSRDKQSGAASL